MNAKRLQSYKQVKGEIESFLKALEGTNEDGMDLSALLAGLSADEMSALPW